MHESGTFKLEAEFDAFYKAGAEPGRERRIGGFVSTEKLDKQSEIVIQKGLDFEQFLSSGWFNDNHGSKTEDVLGYPELAKYVSKGEVLPSGSTADRTGWYVEGYLLQGYEPADKIWALANALQKSKRRLGYSIEGKVHQRGIVNGNQVVVKASVKNIAITRCPVNTDGKLEVLAKSMDGMVKALGMGPGAAQPVGPVSGIGAGKVLAPESIEGYHPDKKKKKRKKKMSKADSLIFLARKIPDARFSTIERVYNFALAMKVRGVLVT